MRIIDAITYGAVRIYDAVAYIAHRIGRFFGNGLHCLHLTVWRGRSLSFKEWVIYGGLGAFSLWLVWFLYVFIAYSHSSAANKVVGSVWLISGIVMCWVLAWHFASKARKHELRRELALARVKV